MKKIFSEALFEGKARQHFASCQIISNPDSILKKTGKGIEALRLLKNDAHIWSCMQSRKSGTLAMKLQLIGKENTLVQFYQNYFDLINYDSLLRDILDALFYGYQPIELVWQEIEIENETYILPIKFIALPQEYFIFNNRGELIFNKYTTQYDKIPEYKIILARHENNMHNPYGESLLSKCYWHYNFKNGAMRFWVTFAEKYGMPLLIGRYTRGASNEEIQKLAETLSAFSQDGIIVSPSDIEVKLEEAARQSSVDLYEKLIEMCNNEISKAILSQTLTTEVKNGSYAASQTHFEIRKELIQADALIVENTLNEIILLIAEVNGLKNTFLPKAKLVYEEK